MTLEMTAAGTASRDAGPPLFECTARTVVTAAPDCVYATVSDLTRCAEWSVECCGGTWVSGEPGAVGSVFRGENVREEQIVAWAPVVRGTWFTTAEVVAAEPGHVFAWAMRSSSGVRQDSVWSFRIEPAIAGCVLVHHFRMGAATEGITHITADMDGAARRAFFAEWGEKVAADLAVTVDRVRVAIEAS